MKTSDWPVSFFTEISIKFISLLLLVVGSTALAGDVYDTMAVIVLQGHGTPLPDFVMERITEVKGHKKGSVSDEVAAIIRAYYTERAGKTLTKDDFSKKEMHVFDEVLDSILGGKGEKEPQKGHSPQLILTAGAPGSGKSSMLELLGKMRLYDSSHFVVYDPDKLRMKLPTYHGWISFDEMHPFSAELSTLTMPELNYFYEVVVAESRKQGKNLLIDGTLRATDYFAKFISELRRNDLDHKHTYQVGIIHIDVSKETAKKRVKERFETTGRNVEERFQEQASPAVINESASKLTNLVDFYLKIENPDSPNPVQFQRCLINECGPKNSDEFLKKFQPLHKVLMTKLAAGSLPDIEYRSEVRKGILEIMGNTFSCLPKEHQRGKMDKAEWRDTLSSCVMWLKTGSECGPSQKHHNHPCGHESDRRFLLEQIRTIEAHSWSELVH
ncbi:MAG: zeta toxin family protein [Bdellovibrio sp.]|nr:zeta toxin family protein [Bdellovibrio sp.]